LHGGKVLVLAGADHQTRSEAVAAQNQLVHVQPPPTKVTISSTSPEASFCSPWRAFFTTSPLRSTATRSPRTPRCCNSADTVSPQDSSIYSQRHVRSPWRGASQSTGVARAWLQ